MSARGFAPNSNSSMSEVMLCALSTCCKISCAFMIMSGSTGGAEKDMGRAGCSIAGGLRFNGGKFGRFIIMIGRSFDEANATRALTRLLL